MNRALQLVALLMALLALSMHGAVDAACKVKADDAAGNDADAGSSTSNGNKIQDAPTKRMTNKIAFDVVDEEAIKRKRLANKIAFDVTSNNATNYDDESTSADDDSA